MKRTLFVSMLLIAGCSAASKGSRTLDAGSSVDAFELLARSAADSCSICARDLRTRAFRILEQRYPPGALVETDSMSGFMRAAGRADELVLVSDPGGSLPLTFRFHTAEDHLVGISESDMTEQSLADRVRTARERTVFRGTLEIVPFAYGDGPTFLYHASDNRVEVHCRIVELIGE